MGIKRLDAPAQPNARQMRFAYEYSKDHNGTKAAIRAGYGEAGAGVEASRILKIPSVQALIEQHEADARAASGITRERILKQYARLAFTDPKKFYDKDGNLKAIIDLDDDTAASLTGLEVEEDRDLFGRVVSKTKKIKFSDSKGALDSLARMEGLNLPDKVEQSGRVESVVTIQRGTDG